MTAVDSFDGSLVPSNGKRFDVPGIAACHYGADGKPTRRRDFWDVTRMLTQLRAPA
ncbi:hypothetical protein [Mycolicibacterium sp. P9-22]|uniref:hypothetical protein n=1 Tax=Mycolicibacterium sp. P9-22 TaxID=2024613 RepID=UPI00188334A1|nr:hypothetical protein [Mycolicibacterium sp. P9-22]